jgi:cold shock CspA family protein
MDTMVKKRLFMVIWTAIALAGCQSTGRNTVNRDPVNIQPVRTASPTSERDKAAEETSATPSSSDNGSTAGNGDRYTGVVNWFSPQKGYGFITTDDGDIFVHHSGIRGEGFRVLEEGQQVEFSIEEGPKGPEAIDVMVLGGEASISTPGASIAFDDSRRYTGSVNWFNPQKGYGFITTDDGDIFVHYSGIRGEGFRVLEEGQQVEFSITEGPKGLEAIDVIVLGP